MDYLKNHCWCSKSHWDNEMFSCQIIVGLSSYKKDYQLDWSWVFVIIVLIGTYGTYQ